MTNFKVKKKKLVHLYVFVGFSDINECMERRDICNHVCTNTIGSYNCSCRDGYYLHQDEKTCLGKTIILLYNILFFFFLLWILSLMRLKLKLKWRYTNYFLGKILIFIREFWILFLLLLIFTKNGICRKMLHF